MGCARQDELEEELEEELPTEGESSCEEDDLILSDAVTEDFGDAKMPHQMTEEEIMELKGEEIDVPGLDAKVDTKSYYLWLGTRLDTPTLLNEFAGVEPEAAVAKEPPAVPAGVAKEPYDQWWLVVPAVPVQQIVWAEVLEVLPPVHAASEGSEGDGATLEFGTVAVFVPSVPPPIPPSDVFSSSSYTSDGHRVAVRNLSC